MDMIVTCEVFGKEFQLSVPNAASEREAHSLATGIAAKKFVSTFRVVSVTPLPAPQPQRPNLLRKAQDFFKSILMRLPC